MKYIYYLCTHCWKVAIISSVPLLNCPACDFRSLTQVDDLETMTDSLESEKLQMKVWEGSVGK